MLVKVCGLRAPENFDEVCALAPDLIGLIFVPGSPRLVTEGKFYDSSAYPEIKRVGVFQNQDLQIVLNKVMQYRLDYLQLHGDETPEFCSLLKDSGLKIIKAITAVKDLHKVIIYKDCVDIVLLDSSNPGSGEKFNWQILDQYDLSWPPFLLAGGVDLSDLNEIFAIRKTKENFLGIDINSRFELEPGLKDLVKVKQLLQIVKSP